MNKILLSPIKNSDTKNVIKWRNSDLVINNFIDRNKLTKSIHENWLNNKVATGEVYQFIAHDDTNNKDFGSTYLKDINRIHSKAEFGIFIGKKDYIGKGYGAEILKLTINYGFQELKLNKIYARVLSYNNASHNMFVKLGFKEDALLRKDVIVNGKAYGIYCQF